MSFPAELSVPVVDGADLRDETSERVLHGTDVVFRGHVWDVVSEDVELTPGTTVSRDVQRHPGAVTVLALDEDRNVLFIQQYRHPVRRLLWELPAGLLDVADEAPLLAAARELAEEADLVASRWSVLVDWFNSPGGSSEANRVYLAQGLSAVPEADRHVREHEEKDMVTVRVPLEQAVEAVLQGRFANPGSVIGVLALDRALSAGTTLRPADAPWPTGLIRPE